MKRFILAACLSLVCPAGVLAYDDDAIVRQCDAQWGTDFSMVAYCRKQQRDAGETVDQLRNRADAEPTLRTILTLCEGQWGTDYSMVAYCTKQQSESVQDLSSALPEDIPSDTAATIRQQCDAQWGTDYSMVAYCVKKQTEAWRTLR